VSVAVPPDVKDLIDAFVASARAALGGNLVGVYLRGSLALGDFRPDSSDVDLLAVTNRPVCQSEAEALFDLDARLAEMANPYARRYEVVFVDRATLRRFELGQRCLGLGQGERLHWTTQRENWILERWAVREHGVSLLGPPPDTLIDPIGQDELMAAVRRELSSWREWAEDADDPDWSLHLGHKAYVVETTCRMLHTLSTGELASKLRATAWAIETLPEPWPALVAASRGWLNNRAKDSRVNAEVRAFVLWAAEGAQNTEAERSSG